MAEKQTKKRASGGKSTGKSSGSRKSTSKGSKSKAKTQTPIRREVGAGVCLLLTVLGFNFVGDGLRDAFDPKMKR